MPPVGEVAGGGGIPSLMQSDESRSAALQALLYQSMSSMTPQRVYSLHVASSAVSVQGWLAGAGNGADTGGGAGPGTETSGAVTLDLRGVQRTAVATNLDAVRASLHEQGWVEELDRMRSQADGSVKVERTLVGTTMAVGGSLSVGYVLWLLRGGLLLSSLLSSLPAWHVIDPLPVLGRRGDDDTTGEDDLDPLERLFAKARNAVLPGREAATVPASPATPPHTSHGPAAQPQLKGA